MKTDPVQRLLSRLVAPDPKKCWVIPGTTDRPVVSVGGRQVRASHVMLSRFIGPPPEGKPFALHSCSEGRCFNPSHLRWGNHKDNMDDRPGDPQWQKFLRRVASVETRFSSAQRRQIYNEYLALQRHPSGRLKNGERAKLAKRWGLSGQGLDYHVRRVKRILSERGGCAASSR